jgi:HAD superfamily hydrolase (TIGR01490 family)
MQAKVALFDFCETLVSFQTADAYVHYCRHKLDSKWMNFMATIHNVLIKTQVIRMLNYLFPRLSINKRLILLQLRGLPYTLLDKLAFEYYIKCLKPSLILPLLNELKNKKLQGYEIWIVSGGYDIYLKYIVREFDLNGLIATRIGFSNSNICSGCFDGRDCLRENKTNLLNERIPLNRIDLENSYAYSDSITDLPMLQWVGNGIVVSKYTSQKWVNENGLKEIIWE